MKALMGYIFENGISSQEQSFFVDVKSMFFQFWYFLLKCCSLFTPNLNFLRIAAPAPSANKIYNRVSKQQTFLPKTAAPMTPVAMI